MSGNNIIKYVFSAVVIVLILGTMYFIVRNRSQNEDYTLDQTSTSTNIQTDLRFAISEYDTINPILSNNRNVQEISKIIYEPLVTLDETYKMEYCLAKEIAKVDEVTYLVSLRDDVYWHDGSKFTANDVAYTIGLIYDLDSVYSENIKYITEVQVIDDTTIKFILTEEVQFFEYNLTFPIMCESYYSGEDFATSEKTPIGTGIFKISEVNSNIIKLVKNDSYWDTSKDAMATEININIYSNSGEAYSAFKNGEIDILSVNINNVEDYIGTLGYNKIEFKGRNYDFMALNTAEGFLTDSAVRKAISLLIDKDSMVASCLGSGYTASNFSLDMGCWLYTKDLTVSVDYDQATELLNSSGWEYTSNSWVKKENGTTERLTLSISVNANNESRVLVAENIEQQLENFGIPVTINYLSDEKYETALNDRSYEIIITGLQLSYSPNLTTFFGNGNLANYYNDEVTEIMNTISNTTDDNVLYENYERLYDIYLDDAPYIGLYRNTNIVVYNQSLVGNIKANLFNIYHNIEKWYRQ